MSVCSNERSEWLNGETLVIIKLRKVAASDMRMRHVLIILTVTFIQGHTDLNHENSNIIYVRLFQKHLTNAHHVCCEDSPTKGLYKLCQSDDLDLHARSQLRFKQFNDLHLHARSQLRLKHFDDLHLDARSQWLGRGNKSVLNYLDN